MVSLLWSFGSKNKGSGAGCLCVTGDTNILHQLAITLEWLQSYTCWQTHSQDDAWEKDESRDPALTHETERVTLIVAWLQCVKNMWTQRKWWNWSWKTNKTQFEIYPLQWSDLWKLYPTLSMYIWDTAVSAWWVPRYAMEVHKNWCLEVLFHFFSHLKEEQTGSLNPLWWCETWVHHFTQNEL